MSPLKIEKGSVNLLVGKNIHGWIDVSIRGKNSRTQSQRSWRRKELKSKLKQQISKQNPPSQRQLPQKYQTPEGMIRRIIKRLLKLEAEVREKHKVHALPDAPVR